jgi:SSS family solute:Na+ symporter
VNIHLALLIVYSAALVAIGIWIARRVRGSADFFVAGRSLNAPLIFATFLAANVGAGATIGTAGLAYRDGLSAWWWNGAAAIGSIGLALFVGPRIWRIAAEHQLYTAGDYLELRYDRSVRGIIAILTWVGTLALFAGQLIAGAAILAVVGHIPRELGIIASASVVTIYFVAGGLLSSAWVNAVELAVKLFGFMLATTIVLASIGGVGALAASPAAPPRFMDLAYSSGPASGWTFLMLLVPAFIVSPGLLQKAYGASSERAVRIGVGTQALAQGAFAFIPVLLGMVARITHPGILDSNQVLPTVIVEQLPPWISALALAAVYSAEVSTCDAVLFMLSTSLSKDLYKRFLRPQATDAQLLRVARLAALAGGIGGVILAFRLQTVIGALRIFYTLLGVSLFVPVMGGLYVRRATTGAALASIAAGATAALWAQFGTHAAAWWFDPSFAGIGAAAVAFAVTLLIRSK